jgi:actin-related protein
MADLRERRRQLLNLTITEIILIILFLVLLIAGSLIKKNKELRDQNQIFKNLDVDALQLAEFQKFKELIAELKEKNGEFADMDIDEIVSELVLAKEKFQEIKDKESEIAKLMDKLKDYEKAKELLAYYEERYGNDKPPCWKKAGTVAKPEYLFDAIINDTGIILKNTDSRYPHRVVDRKNLPLGEVTEDIALNAQQFLNQTKAVFVLNKETCRHYLLVKDLSGNNKNHFKKYLSSIEDRFYKYEDK